MSDSGKFSCYNGGRVVSWQLGANLAQAPFLKESAFTEPRLSSTCIATTRHPTPSYATFLHANVTINEGRVLSRISHIFMVIHTWRHRP